MTALVAHELAKALGRGEVARLPDGLFAVSFPAGFGEIRREASPALLRDILPEACALARESVEDVKEFLNALLPEGFDPSAHTYGKVLDRREVQALAASLFGGGPEYVKQREVLVEVTRNVDFFYVSEWVNPPTPKNRLVPGDKVWVGDDRLRNFEPV